MIAVDLTGAAEPVVEHDGHRYVLRLVDAIAAGKSGVVSSDGSLPPSTYLRAVFRSMPAFIAACPMCPCLLISSINFLTWASLAGEHGARGVGVERIFGDVGNRTRF